MINLELTELELALAKAALDFVTEQEAPPDEYADALVSLEEKIRAAALAFSEEVRLADNR